MRTITFGGRSRKIVNDVTKLHWIVMLAVLGLTALTYSPIFRAGFVFDSKFLVLQDQRVHEWSTDNLRLIFAHSYWWPIGESGLYRPLTTLSILLNYLVAGERAVGYHAANLGLHVVNMLLVFLVCKSITSKPMTAALTCALWAVIPIGAEAVANVAGRADLLSTTFALASFLCYVRVRRRAQQRVRGRQYTFWLLALSLCLTLAVFTKESAIVVVPLVVIHLRLTRDTAPPLSTLPLLCALGVPIVFLFAVRWLVLGQVLTPTIPFVDNPIAHTSWLVGRLTALRVLGEDLQLFVWPHPLIADYSYPQIRFAAGTVAEIKAWSTILLAVAVGWYYRNHFDVSIGFLIALVAILPVSNLFFAIGTIKAERLMYMPSIGLCLALVGIGQTVSKTRQASIVSWRVLAAIVGTWSSRTYARAHDWQSDITLWHSAVAHGTQSAKAHRALAEALYEADPKRDNLDTVLEHARKAAALLDDLPLTLRSFQEYRQLAAYNLDKAHSLADPNEAAPFFRDARSEVTVAINIVDADDGNEQRVRTSLADLHRIRAAANTGLGRYADGVEDARIAIGLDIFSEQAYLLAADALLALRDPDAAAQELITGGLVLPSPRLSDELTRLYRAADPLGCSVQVIGGRAVVNPQCPVVRQHLCAGSAQAVRLLQSAERVEQANALATRTKQSIGCN